MLKGRLIEGSNGSLNAWRGLEDVLLLLFIAGNSARPPAAHTVAYFTVISDDQAQKVLMNTSPVSAPALSSILEISAYLGTAIKCREATTSSSKHLGDITSPLQ